MELGTPREPDHSHRSILRPGQAQERGTLAQRTSMAACVADLTHLLLREFGSRSADTRRKELVLVTLLVLW